MVLNHICVTNGQCIFIVPFEPARLFFEFHCRHNDSPLGVVEFAGDLPSPVAIVLPCLLYIPQDCCYSIDRSIVVTGSSNGDLTCSDG